MEKGTVVRVEKDADKRAAFAALDRLLEPPFCAASTGCWKAQTAHKDVRCCCFCLRRQSRKGKSIRTCVRMLFSLSVAGRTEETKQDRYVHCFGGADYKDPTPENNPNTSFKMASGATLTIENDVIFDNIILFQENKQNTIAVSAGATLTVTDTVVLMSKPGNDYHFRILLDEGATAILSEAAQKVMTVEGSGTLLTYGDSKPAESPFKPTRGYENTFADVTNDKWFYTYVKTAYEYALANGTSTTAFSPDGKFTVAQALTAAVNIHTAYTGKTVRAAAAGEAWYMPYATYCIENGIIKDGQFADYNKNITRGDMAIVFANILPDSEYAAIREKVLPDVTDGMPCAAAVRKLANAGIVGGDNKGNYNAANEITRAEACVIFTRTAVASMRDGK